MGRCLSASFSGNGGALPSSNLGGGKRSVVSASAWCGVCLRVSVAMAGHCPPVIWVEGNAPSFSHLRGAVSVCEFQWQWQGIALQRFGWRETLRRFRICVGRCLSASFSGNGGALPSSNLGGGKRSVVSASAWRGVCLRVSVAMAEHCPPVIWVEGNALSFPRLRGAVSVCEFEWQWQSIALQ